MEEVKQATTEVALEREMDLVRGAVSLVAAGVATRVVVAGIRFGNELLDPARRMALEAGLRVVPLWRRVEGGVDIAVEAIR